MLTSSYCPGSLLLRGGTALVMLGLAGAPAARAQHPQEQTVESALERLERALDGESGIQDETKGALRDLIAALRAERAADGSGAAPPASGAVSEEALAGAVNSYLEAHPPVAAEKPWDKILERLKVYGDVRLRYQGDFNRYRRSSRNQELLRLRLGFEYEPVDDWFFGARATTGDPERPGSPYQKFGDLFDRFEFNIDRGYIRYAPKSIEGLWFTGGKFGNPFKVNPVYGQLHWDDDIQPEGVAAGYSFKDLGFLDTLGVTVAELITIEQDNLDEGSAFFAQLTGDVALTDELDLFSALGWYHYVNVMPDGSQVILAENRTNAVSFGEFESRFSIVHPIIALTYKGLPRPLTFSGEWYENLRAAHGRGSGWATGVAYGQTKKAHDYRVYYQYQEIERDAILSAVAGSEFPVVSAMRGHMAGVQYQLAEKLQLHVFGMFAEQGSQSTFFSNDDDHDVWRLRVDLTLSF